MTGNAITLDKPIYLTPEREYKLCLLTPTHYYEPTQITPTKCEENIETTTYRVEAFFLNILEEIRFFKNTDANIQYPIFLTFLNVPTILYELFPFVILPSSILHT
mgnify:CR=1 FL=1